MIKSNNNRNKEFLAEPGKEFVFKLKDGKEVGRTGTINGFESLIRALPVQSLEFHNEGKHFSPWLRYMKQGRLAAAFNRIDSKGETLREELLSAIKKYKN